MAANMAHHAVRLGLTVGAEHAFLLFVSKGQKDRLAVLELDCEREIVHEACGQAAVLGLLLVVVEPVRSEDPPNECVQRTILRQILPHFDNVAPRLLDLDLSGRGATASKGENRMLGESTESELEEGLF